MTEETPPAPAQARRPGPNTVAGVQPRADGGQFRPGDDRRELTELQARFAVFYAENGGNAAKAAADAGYSATSAPMIGPRLVRLPWVARAVEIERKRFLNEAGLASLQLVVEIVRDVKAEKRLRLKAAEVALKAVAADRDGQKNTAGAGKALSQMTVSELEALVRRLDQAAELAQQPILEHAAGDNEQSPAPITDQPIDPAVKSTVL